MTKREKSELKNILLEISKFQAEIYFQNTELSHRERIREKRAYLTYKYELLTPEEHEEFRYLTFLIGRYYIDNPIKTQCERDKKEKSQ